jgi:protein-S-isoprenylcysteine O-methyltransferase Ste14
MLSNGLALGSYVAAPLTLVYLPALAYRTITEDRFLRANLEGYADYAKRVRYKVIPGIW